MSSDQNPHTRECFLGIDIGTSGCRMIAIDKKGLILQTASCALPTPKRQGHEVEQDPWLWWQSLEDLLLRCVPTLSHRPVSLAIDGTSATLLVTDGKGQPLDTALMYNDARAKIQAEQLAVLLPEQSAAHGASSSLAKLLWWREHRFFTSGLRVLHQADWLAGKLTGQFDVMDENNASKLGYDPIQRTWPACLQALDLPTGIWPKVLPVGMPWKRMRHDMSRHFGLPDELLVVAGTTDSVAAFLATGAQQPGDAVTSLGSTLVLKLVAKKPIFAPKYGIYSHRLFDQWLVGGASNTGGAVLGQYFNPDEIEALSETLQPDRPTGLDYYPLIAPGERFPIADPTWQPRLTPRPDDDAVFLQGLLEGMAAIEAQGYQRLIELGASRPSSIRTTGKGAENQAWARIRKHVTGIEVITPKHTQAAYGAALLARSGYVTWQQKI